MNYYDIYVEQLYILHNLIALGEDEGSEGEAVRDKMDEPWRHLTKEEKEQVRKISELLYEKTDLI